MSGVRRLFDSRWAVMATGSALVLASCVISPRREFKYSYEKILVGHSYADTVEKWPGSKVLVSSTSTGTKVVKVYAGQQCNLFYEVDNDKITRAWDDDGKDCWKAN